MQEPRHQERIAKADHANAQIVGVGELLHNRCGRGEAVDDKKWDQGAAGCGGDSWRCVIY